MEFETGSAGRLWGALSQALGEPVGLRLRLWDGSHAGPDGAATLIVNDRQGLRRLVWSPGALSVVRAYVAREVDVDGSLYDVLSCIDGFADAEPMRVMIGARTARLAGFGRHPAIPAEEDGQTETGYAFLRCVLGESMSSSSAVWARDRAGALDAAQRSKLDLAAAGLGLRPGMRVLDIGAGWGGFAVHAARDYGVQVVALSPSEHHAAWARSAARRAGVSAATDFRVQDHRAVDDGPFDAVVNLETAERLGDRYGEFAARAFALLKPRARLYNQQATRRIACSERDKATYLGRYVLPGRELIAPSAMIGALDGAGFHIRRVVEMTGDYAPTLQRWERNLLEHREHCVALTSEARVRAFHVHLVASRLWFERRRLALHRVVVERPAAPYVSGHEHRIELRRRGRRSRHERPAGRARRRHGRLRCGRAGSREVRNRADAVALGDEAAIAARDKSPACRGDGRLSRPRAARRACVRRAILRASGASQRRVRAGCAPKLAPSSAPWPPRSAGPTSSLASGVRVARRAEALSAAAAA